MKKVTIWIGRNEVLIPADLIPGSIADALYPRQIRNQVGVDLVATGSASSITFERLKEERKQATKLREKYPKLPENHSFTKCEAQEYLVGLGMELEVRHFAERCDPPSELTDARCIEISGLSELFLEHWIELTGIGVGECRPYMICKDKVAFINWDDGYIADAPISWQVEMLRDNRVASDLTFPCTPVELLQFVDTAVGIHCFSVPDVFRNAVPDNKQMMAVTAPAPQSSKEPHKGDPFRPKVGWQIDLFDSWVRICQTYARTPTTIEAIAWLKRNSANGVILNEGKRNELWWKPHRKDKKKVNLHHVESVISSWKTRGVLPS